jgi:hypothetical protein
MDNIRIIINLDIKKIVSFYCTDVIKNGPPYFDHLLQNKAFRKFTIADQLRFVTTFDILGFRYSDDLFIEALSEVQEYIKTHLLRDSNLDERYIDPLIKN